MSHYYAILPYPKTNDDFTRAGRLVGALVRETFHGR
jgi:hypothetical protein